ncbi:RNA polymerase sigma-70 factor, ECF subfamily [Catalinimonas alkaloidigena]|uniref:RNA polymerase sigma-70 factor, ECF subfamily n=1 Tax=Catalinimonas alkaloidigena TaxID=1075417 RepID=A0A1G8YEN6_9BACT|nr:RNA polymerase sigma-70 factor, ECF subfamily [Catalinimonas alkaloidigena]
MLSDAHLWARFQAGDREAFAAIYQRYGKLLTQYGMRLVHDKERVRDAVQDLFVYLWEKRMRLGAVRSLPSYLLISLRRQLLQARTSRYGALGLERTDESATEMSVERQLIQEQERGLALQRLTKAMEALPDRQREAIFLRYYCELDFPDVAEVMAINTRSVYKLMYKAIEHMRKNFPTLTFSLILLCLLLG